MNGNHLDSEDKLLAARLDDLRRLSSAGSRFSPFFNERQQLLAEEIVRQRKWSGCMWYGGYPDALRRMLGIFPLWEEPEEGAFPLAVVAAALPRGAAPTHRDVLGSLMSLGIKREGIGDILLPEGERIGYIFVQRHLAPLLQNDLKKIGGYGVRCALDEEGKYTRNDRFESRTGTVRSPRLDALVALLTGLSRAKSAVLLEREQVQLGYRTVCSASAGFSAGDVITVRGYGKYKVDEIGSPTKKGRLPVIYRKYI